MKSTSTGLIVGRLIPTNITIFITITFLLISAFGITTFALAHSHRNSIEANTTLRIDINTPTDYFGTLEISFPEQLESTEPFYIILPFIISDVLTENEYTEVTYKIVDGKSTILQMIIAPSIKQSRISFHIHPPVIEATEVGAYSLNRNTNFLLVENRGASRFTLYFRLNIEKNGNTFGSLSKFTDSMQVPSEIIFRFPEATTFFTIPPAAGSSNVLPNQNTEEQTTSYYTITTRPQFYRDDYLWINYSFPPATFSLEVILHILLLALSPLGAVVLALPEDIITRRSRLIVTATIVIAVLALFFINLGIGGKNYLESNVVSLIPGGALYLLSLVLLIMNAYPLIRIRRGN